MTPTTTRMSAVRMDPEYPPRGLNLREYYAGLALQGLVARQHIGGMTNLDVARRAVMLADALLAALDEEAGR